MQMPLSLRAETVALRKDADEVIRIGDTRVTLDTLVAAFLSGASAESLVDRYPSLQLDQVYSVIGYYLRNKAEVEAYLQERRLHADKVRAENEARCDPVGIRERLLARKKVQ
jgi:uncharacterized protein (DUF433 family)